MKDGRVWHIVGEDEPDSDHLLKRFVIVATVAVVAGFALSFAHSKWSRAAVLTSAVASQAPAESSDADAVLAEDEDRADQPASTSAEPERTSNDRDEILNGEWQLTTHVRSATRKEFEGALLYRVQLKQEGERVTGQGEKIGENGKTVPTNQRTPITVEGEREGDRLMLKFTERGARRASGGTFFLRLDDDGLHGTFASDAAGSKGEVSATRIRSGTSAPKQKSRAR